MFEIIDNPRPNEMEETARLLAATTPENITFKFIEAAGKNLPMAIRQLRASNANDALEDRRIRHVAVLKAMTGNSAYALKEVLQYRAFDLTDSAEGDKDLLSIMMTQAAANKTTSLQYVLFTEATKYFKGAKDIDNRLLQIMKNSGASSDMMDFISGAALGQYASKQLLQKIACETNAQDTDFFRMMIAHMLDKAMNAEDMSSVIAQNKAGFAEISGEIIQEFNKRGLISGDLDEVCAEYAEAVEKARYTREDKYTLSDTQNLAGGIRLTTIFNFRLRQQIMIAERNGQSMTMDVKSFDDILGHEALAAVRQKLVELGGEPDNVGSGKKPRPSAPSLNNPGGRV